MTLPIKRPSPIIGQMSAKRPSKYEYQFKHPPPLWPKCVLLKGPRFVWMVFYTNTSECGFHCLGQCKFFN